MPRRLKAVGETKYTGVGFVRKYARISEMPRSVVEVSAMVVSLLAADPLARARSCPTAQAPNGRGDLHPATVAAGGPVREGGPTLSRRRETMASGGQMASVPGAGGGSLLHQVLRRKPVGEMTAETGVDSGEGELARSIGLFQLTLFGVGATIGTGIFIVLTQAVPVAGPAVVWSFVLAGAVAGFTAICYAELASAVPVSGSSYSYAYATLGEGVAMVVAACLLLEYGVSAAAVAVGWSQYLNELPDNLSDFTPFGLNGITSAAGIIFFSYIGLDAVSTAGEEVKNPRRTMPLAIIGALVIVTGLYVLVTIVAVAAQPFRDFEGQDAGLSAILEHVTGSTWPATILAAGAVISIFSVTLVVLYGQSRILFAMSRDGMIPAFFHKLNPRTLTPVGSTLVVAVIVSLLAGFIPINFLAEMTSIGTLTAFLIVSVGVVILRRRAPDLPRGFKVP